MAEQKDDQRQSKRDLAVKQLVNHVEEYKDIVKEITAPASSLNVNLLLVASIASEAKTCRVLKDFGDLVCNYLFIL